MTEFSKLFMVVAVGSESGPYQPREDSRRELYRTSVIFIHPHTLAVCFSCSAAAQLNYSLGNPIDCFLSPPCSVDMSQFTADGAKN